MKPPKRPQAALFAFALLVALLSNGCAKDPRLQLAQAHHTLSAVELRLVEEARDGNLSKGEVLLIDPAIQAARATLDDADARLAAGDKQAFRADMKVIDSILLRLARVYLPATTQPAVQP